MERQGQHQEKYPQIEVAGVVEFVLVRVVVPAPGHRCPDSLTQGLHNLGDHLSSSPLRLDGRMLLLLLLLGYNEMISSNACYCRYASMLGRYSTSAQPSLSCLIGLPRCCPLVLLFPSQCRFVHFCCRGPHLVLSCSSLSLSLSSLAACTDAQL